MNTYGHLLVLQKATKETKRLVLALAFGDRKPQQLFVTFVFFCKSLKGLGRTLTGSASFATFVFKIRIRQVAREPWARIPDT
jgi:hypothetical protein